MKFDQAHSELDGNLPNELKSTADFLGVQKQSSPTSNVSQPSEDSTMSTNPAPTGATANVALTNEQVVAAARAEVEKMLDAKDSQAQIALTIARYANETNEAKAALIKAQAELATARQTNPQTQENVTTQGADADAKAWHKEKDAAYAALNTKVDELTKVVAAKDKEINNFKAGDKKKGREDKIDKSKLKSDKFKKRATACADDGSLLMSDADFEAALAELLEVAPAATETTTETPEPTAEEIAAAKASGTPIPAPSPKTGPAGSQKAPSLTGSGKGGATPVAAPNPKTGPASSQTAPKMAHASDGTVTEEAPAQVAASTTPASPDLSQADIMAQAQAAMLSGGPVATDSGKSAYAKAFGA